MKLLLVSSLFLVILYHVTAQGIPYMQDQNNRVTNMNYSKYHFFEIEQNKKRTLFHSICYSNTYGYNRSDNETFIWCLKRDMSYSTLGNNNYKN